MLNTDEFTCKKIKTTGAIPEKRSGHSSAVIRNRLYIYGGYGNNNGVSDEIYCLDTNSREWESIATLRGDVPEVRDYMSFFNFGG